MYRGLFQASGESLGRQCLWAPFSGHLVAGDLPVGEAGVKYLTLAPDLNPSKGEGFKPLPCV